MKRPFPVWTATLFMLLSFATEAVSAPVGRIVVGSKTFTESYVLAEIASQVLENSTQTPIDRKLGLGSTGIIFEALKNGSVDLYPDYTGTLAETILKQPELKSIDDIRAALKPLGLTISASLGFNDTYALAIKESFATKHNLNSISDLRTIASSLRAAFSYEFMDRKDGYGGLVKQYSLEFEPANVKAMEHSLVYKALKENAVDVIEVYSTDANIQKFGLRILKDDLAYFPVYQAVWVARSAFTTEHPTEWKSLLKLQGAIDEKRMIAMNAAADIDKKPFGQIASEFLGSKFFNSKAARSFNVSDQIIQRTSEHLWLVGIALAFSIIIGVPLGIFSARSQILGQSVLLFSALVQTIPALALLCFLIPMFGVGLKPALVALCLYSLLPVVLNTFTGLRSIDEKHIENAKAFGLSPAQILTRITLPLASPVILAGIKTATIVSIGTATLAALIGAGGYGALIVSGLSLNHVPTILAGAVPAALMALVAYFIFGLAAKVLVPKGLRK